MQRKKDIERTAQLHDYLHLHTFLSFDASKVYDLEYCECGAVFSRSFDEAGNCINFPVKYGGDIRRAANHAPVEMRKKILMLYKVTKRRIPNGSTKKS